MKRVIFLCLLSLISLCAKSQDEEHGSVMRYIIEGKDTTYIDDLPPAYKFSKPPKGKKGKQWRQYYRLVHNFAKTYPYALLAKEKVGEANDYLETHNLSKRERERYINKFQDDLFDTFEKPLRDLTYSQGRLLLRLIDRETGLTSYYIVRNFKGRAAAGFWQAIAKIFDSDMKKPYDRFNDDKQTEELVQIYQKGEFNYFYASIFGRRPPQPVQRAKCDYPQY